MKRFNEAPPEAFAFYLGGDQPPVYWLRRIYLFQDAFIGLMLVVTTETEALIAVLEQIGSYRYDSRRSRSIWSDWSWLGRSNLTDKPNPNKTQDKPVEQ